MKALKRLLIAFAMPFLVIWACWLLSAGAFNPYEVFNCGAFWGMSVIYWFIMLLGIGFILEAQ